MRTKRPMIGERQSPHAPRSIMVLLVVCMLLGVLGAVMTVLNGRAQTTASAEDVRRNGVLLERVNDLAEQLGTDHDRSDEQIRALCAQVQAIARELHITVAPCPMPSPSTSP